MFLFSHRRSLLYPYADKKEFTVPDEPLMVLSFDDGFETDFTHAYQAMSSAGVSGTSYINTVAVGGSNMLKWNQIHEMHNDGWDFQCHGHTHTRWTEFTTEQAIRSQIEQVDSAFLSQGLPVPKHHAWPYGVITPEAESIIWEYRVSQRNAGSRVYHYNDHDTAFPLVRSFGGDTQLGDTDKYSLCRDFIRAVHDLHKVGVMYFHRFYDGEAESGIYTPYFVDYLNYILDLGVRIVTVNELYNILVPHEE